MSEKVWIKLPGGAQGWGCDCMAKTLPLIEAEMKAAGIIKYGLDVFQWGYNPGKVSKSAGTHDLGGVIDVNQFSQAARAIWAKWGVMMFPRTRLFGWWTGNHGHGVWHGCPHQVPYTDWQVRSGIAGGDGLGSSATLKGKRWRKFVAPNMTWQQAVAKYGTDAKRVRAQAQPAKKPLVKYMGTISFDQYKKGSKSHVRVVQGWLKKMKPDGKTPYYTGPWDGVNGPMTKAAIAKWQKIKGYPATGVLTGAQFKRLADWGKLKATGV